MTLPIIDFRGTKIVNEDGTFSDVAQNYFDSLNSYLIGTIGSEGLVAPSQSASNISIIANNQNSSGGYTCQFGTFIFNTDVNDPQVAINNGSGVPVFVSILTPGGITLTGVTNQIAITGSAPNFIIGLSSVLHTVNGTTLDDGSGNMTIAGTLTLSGDPVTNLQSATKQYVDSKIAGDVTSITGTANQITASSPTGAVTLSFPSVLHSSNNVLDDGTGIATFVNIIDAGLTASQPILTNGSKQLVSGQINLASTSFVTGILPLANGGTSAALTASNGGIFYSTASSGAILAGTATSHLPLLSGLSSSPAWGAFALSLGGALTTAGSLTTLGSFGATFTFTALTGVTFPTSGTLATVSGTISGILGTANQITASTVSTVTTLSFPSVLHSANNVLDDGSGNVTFNGTSSASLVLNTTNATNCRIQLGFNGTTSCGTIGYSTSGVGFQNGNGDHILQQLTSSTTDKSLKSNNTTLDDGSGNMAFLASATLSTLTTGTLNVGNATTSINIGGSTAVFAANGGNVQILNTSTPVGTFQLATGSGTNVITIGNNTGATATTILGNVTINNAGANAVNIGTGTFTGSVVIGGNGITLLANSTGAITLGNGLNTVNLGSSGSTGSVVNIQVGSGSNQTNICTGSYAGTLTIGNALATLNINAPTTHGSTLTLHANAASALQAVPLQQLSAAGSSANIAVHTYCGGF